METWVLCKFLYHNLGFQRQIQPETDKISISRGQEPERFEKDILDTIKINTIGPIHLFTFFLPLLRNGSAKKAIAISTGMADAEMISKFAVAISPSYAISKGALNVAVAKFDAQYRKEGILFLAISPGLVDTGKGASREYSLSTFAVLI
jgi:NAD(P)-dependent dehydrogenase (short-subunit alcohol dehydrogenase family)